MVNKISGTFTKADEESFATFAVYCGLALHHARVSSISIFISLPLYDETNQICSRKLLS